MAKIKLTSEQGNFKNVQPILTPLVCHTCGYHIPLVNADEVICPSCASKVTIPEEYRKLRQLKDKEKRAIQEASSVSLGLLNPPNRWERLWLAVSENVIGSAQVVISIVIILGYISITLGGIFFLVLVFSLYLICHALAPAWGINYNDVFGADVIYLVFYSIVSLVFILPLALYRNAQKHTALKKVLQASMASKIKIHSGKTLHNCRNCGAGLPVQSTDIATVCDYCGADNLVQLSPAWTESIIHSAKWYFKTLDEAVRLAHTYIQDYKREFRNWIIGTLLIIPISWSIGYIVIWAESNGAPYVVPHWKKVYVREMQGKKIIPDQFLPNSASAIPINQWQKMEHYAYWMALDKGEVFAIEVQKPIVKPIPILVRGTSTADFETAFKTQYLSIDTSGHALFAAPYKGLFELYFSDTTLRTSIQWKILDVHYDKIEYFNEGLAATLKNGKWGFIDKLGKESIPFKYDYVSSFFDNLALVMLNRKWGFIDKSGKESIPIQYDNAHFFENGKAEVTLNGRTFWIDTTGKEIKE